MKTEQKLENQIPTNRLLQKFAFGNSTRPILSSLLLAGSLGLVGCGGIESNVKEEEELVAIDENEQAASADLLIALTDAEEDFLSYTVGVSSILLTKENGDVVEVLPEKTEVDFVEYQELSELFSVVKAPIAKYTSISIELDYSEAYILIQDEEGVSYEAQVFDSDENLLTTHVVDFQLEQATPLDVKQGKLNHLTLDLDLSASNTIVSFEPAIVSVEPFVVGQVVIDDEREHRVRGTVTSVDTTEQTVTLALKPMRKKAGDFGEFTVTLSDDTVLEIDDETLSLTDALANLDNQDASFPVVTFGTATTDPDTGEVTYVATQLLAGTSVPWDNKNVFKGMITSFEEGVPYINGLVVQSGEQGRSKIEAIPLNYDIDTSFVNHMSIALDDSYLVPGQKLSMTGQLSVVETDMISSFNVEGEVVRIVNSDVMGQVTYIDELGIVTLEVSRFNKRPGKIIKRKNKKSGKRVEIAVEDETLEELALDVSAFEQSDIEVGDWVKVNGVLLPESAATDMDIQSLVEYSVSDSELKYTGYYGQAGIVPVIAADFSMMTLDLVNGRHKLNFRFNPVNMLPEVESIDLVAADTTGKFALAQRGETSLFFDTYAELIESLNIQLAAGESVNKIGANATLSEDNSQLYVTSLIVKLN